MTDEAEIEEIESDIPTPRMLAWVRNSAGYRLGRQMLTEKQLADAIRRKARQKFDAISEGQANALAEAAIKFGHDMKALDDTVYAAVSTRSGVRSGKSKRMIAQKLVQKGIDRETVEAAVEGTDDLYSAVVFARKRGFGPFRRAELDDRRKAKEFSTFARSGFGYDLSKSVLTMSLDEAEDILNSLSLG